MTFNELFSNVGNLINIFFYWLGNTPIQKIFWDLGSIIFGLVFIFAMFYGLGVILDKISFKLKKYSVKDPIFIIRLILFMFLLVLAIIGVASLF